MAQFGSETLERFVLLAFVPQFYSIFARQNLTLCRNGQMSIKSFCPSIFEDFLLICTVFPHFGPFGGGGGGRDKTKFCGQEFYGHPELFDSIPLKRSVFGVLKGLLWRSKRTNGEFGLQEPKPAQIPAKRGKSQQDYKWPHHRHWPQSGSLIKTGEESQKDKRSARLRCSFPPP